MGRMMIARNPITRVTATRNVVLSITCRVDLRLDPKVLFLYDTNSLAIDLVVGHFFAMGGSIVTGTSTYMRRLHGQQLGEFGTWGKSELRQIYTVFRSDYFL